MKKTENWKLNPAEGWKNYYTWNVALFLNNDEKYYNVIKKWREAVKRGNTVKKTYKSFLEFTGLKHCYTSDGVAFSNKNVSASEILKNVLLSEE